VYDIGKALKNNPPAPIVIFSRRAIDFASHPESLKSFMNPTEAKPFYESVHSIYDFRVYRCRYGYSSADGYHKYISPFLPPRLQLTRDWQASE